MDLNVRAFRTVQEAINDDSPTAKAKIASSSRGGLKGGPARARSISRERRVEIAKNASAVRWKKSKRAQHE